MEYTTKLVSRVGEGHPHWGGQKLVFYLGKYRIMEFEVFPRFLVEGKRKRARNQAVYETSINGTAGGWYSVEKILQKMKEYGLPPDEIVQMLKVQGWNAELPIEHISSLFSYRGDESL